MRLLQHLECLNGEFVKVEQDGELVAFCSYAWVNTLKELLQVDRGEEGVEDGKVLYLFNLRIDRADPSLIWALKRRLPYARWIAGLDASYNLHIPRGVPDDFFA